MDIIEKFYADVKRIIKYDRANNANYDGLRASKAVGKHFVSLHRDIADLAFSVVDYWEKNYVESSNDVQSEPSEKNITWLAAALALFDGDYEETATDEEKNAFSHKDWQELCTLVSCEAGELPIETLTALMTVFTDKKAL